MICFSIALWLLVTLMQPAQAAVLTCTGNSGSNGNYAVASGNTKITTPRSATEEFYSVSRASVGAGTINIKCSGNYKINATLINTPTNTLYGNNVTDLAVATTHPSIATIIHASDDIDLMGNVVKAWPEYSSIANNIPAGSSRNYSFSLSVRLRLNFADSMPSVPPGLFGQFTGATLVIYIAPANAGDTIGACPTDSSPLKGDNRTCVLMSRTITSPGTHIYSGSCEMIMPNTVVNMGRHNAATSAPSEWKDASFDIKCPNAWGRTAKMIGGTNTVDDSDAFGKPSPNQALTITLVPYTPVIPSVNGAFELNDAGVSGNASGYGIQLAWGAPSSQQAGNTIPAKAVNFSFPTKLNVSNSNYTAGTYSFGSSAVPVGTDSRVYLSARYIRTSGLFKPGIANGKVEVVVSYN